MSPVSFDPTTKTMFFVPAFFKANPADAFVSWRKGISAGAVIRTGTVIADIFWEDDDGTVEPITSPARGTIRTTNRQISHTTLHRLPPQVALTFV